MGYLVELNTLLGLPGIFDPSTLAVGQSYTIVKERERAFPLHIAVLIVDTNWNFYGYAKVNSAVVTNQSTAFEFTVLSLFSPDEQAIYKKRFVEAAKLTGEIK